MSEGVPPCSAITSPNVALEVCAKAEKGKHSASAAEAKRREPGRIHLGFTERYPFQTRRNYSLTQTRPDAGSCPAGEGARAGAGVDHGCWVARGGVRRAIASGVVCASRCGTGNRGRLPAARSPKTAPPQVAERRGGCRR